MDGWKNGLSIVCGWKCFEFEKFKGLEKRFCLLLVASTIIFCEGGAFDNSCLCCIGLAERMSNSIVVVVVISISMELHSSNVFWTGKNIPIDAAVAAAAIW